MGADGATAARTADAPAGLSQPARPRPGRDERDPACAAHGAASGTRSRRPGSAAARRPTGASGSGPRRACFSSSGGAGCSPTTTRRGSSGSGWRWTARSARRPSAASGPAPIPPTELKGAKRSLLCEGKGVPLGIEPAGANLNDFKLVRATIASSRSSAQADPGVAARALPGQRLRLPRGVRARRRVRVHRPHPRSRRRSQGTQTRGRLPRPSLGRRAHPLLAQTASAASSFAGRSAPTPTSPCSTSASRGGGTLGSHH